MITVGDIIRGQYKLTKFLGGGSFGEVYLAEELISRLRVAIKILTETGKRFQQNFEKEARIMARLRHPNIVQLLGAFSEEPNHFLVLEYCDGGNLADVIHTSGKLPEERALAILNQVCAGLAFAHTYRFETITGIIHRDLKPQNLFLTGDDVVKIGDFGVSRMAAGSQKFSTAIGTPEYMAPEQFDGRYDFRADIYALGIILYQMVVGKTPFSGTFAQVMKRHLTEKPNIPPTVSQHVRSIIERALAKQPEQRFQTVAELQEALKPKPAATEPIPERVAPPPETVAEKEFLQTAEDIKPEPAGEPTIRVKARPKTPERAKKPFTAHTVGLPKKRLLGIGLGLLIIVVILYMVTSRKKNEVEYVKVKGSYLGSTWNHAYYPTFYLGRTEVTNLQYCKFLNQYNKQNQDIQKWIDIENNLCQIELKDGQFSPKSGFENYPVVCVTWYGADAYCKWAGGRLPKIAEWRYAAKGEQKSDKAGILDGFNIDEIAWWYGNSQNSFNPMKEGRGTHPVRAKLPNNLGLYDMIGNVYEWCDDGKITGSGFFKYAIGGSWQSNWDEINSLNERRVRPENSAIDIGFRIIKFK